MKHLRIIALITCIAVTLSFTGCDTDDTGTAEAPVTDETVEETAEETEEADRDHPSSENSRTARSSQDGRKRPEEDTEEESSEESEDEQDISEHRRSHSGDSGQSSSERSNTHSSGSSGSNRSSGTTSRRKKTESSEASSSSNDTSDQIAEETNEEPVSEDTITGGAEILYTVTGDTFALDIEVDGDSYLEFHLKDGITYSGTITIAPSEDADEEYDVVYVIIDEGCTWELTGDCVISEIELNGNIIYNGFTITMADGTVLSEEA